MTLKMGSPRARWVTAVGVLIAAGSCTLNKTEAPPLAGPSELALSVALTANPAVLTQDGWSQSRIEIVARDANSAPARNVSMRAEITQGGQAFDFGRLSTKSIVTDESGRATVLYTAPGPPPEPVDTGTIVTILVTPATGDNRSSQSRSVDIRLVPSGVVLPGNQPPRLPGDPENPPPGFTFSPTTPAIAAEVHFDGSSWFDPDGTIVSYRWSFGDGSSGSGVRVDHEYDTPGQYVVTLTVTDNRGASVLSAPQTVSVGAGTAPTASFTISPLAPAAGEKVFFNGSASTAAPGQRIVSYKWNFGKNTSATTTGVIASTTYDIPGVYTVTLVVTDDLGRQGSISNVVPVVDGGEGGVTAAFNFSPTSPAPGATVFFDASESSSPSPIQSYQWNFGDGTGGSGKFASHNYATTGTYTVTLTIRDSKGKTDLASQNVPVQ